MKISIISSARKKHVNTVIQNLEVTFFVDILHPELIFRSFLQNYSFLFIIKVFLSFNFF